MCTLQRHRCHTINLWINLKHTGLEDWPWHLKKACYFGNCNPSSFDDYFACGPLAALSLTKARNLHANRRAFIWRLTNVFIILPVSSLKQRGIQSLFEWLTFSRPPNNTNFVPTRLVENVVFRSETARISDATMLRLCLHAREMVVLLSRSSKLECWKVRFRSLARSSKVSHTIFLSSPKLFIWDALRRERSF